MCVCTSTSHRLRQIFFHRPTHHHHFHHQFWLQKFLKRMDRIRNSSAQPLFDAYYVVHYVLQLLLIGFIINSNLTLNNISLSYIFPNVKTFIFSAFPYLRFILALILLSVLWRNKFSCPFFCIQTPFSKRILCKYLRLGLVLHVLCMYVCMKF